MNSKVFRDVPRPLSAKIRIRRPSNGFGGFVQILCQFSRNAGRRIFNELKLDWKGLGPGLFEAKGFGHSVEGHL